ncbi:TVP38/TMEM64 family protein [Cohaesibacter celericrescens]|uniref:TVP38/TMEM64 family membrane protein n=1 Tax=Cohaesibacter celericrescens TaxID=2067669 RepID=A0A2N5XJX8_9HYPH|nr:VTT domain-containing protein [Cohaesibacter celericrescens]PLW74821.1 hypothetical protein C0081_21090 [Cohaesibacter celericrescens]
MRLPVSLPPRASKLLVLFLAVIAAIFVVIDPWGWNLTGLFEQESLFVFVDSFGPWGPVIIILLMTVAVVFSPLPSAPIAIVAGAAYGHYAGTLIVVAGATVGAVIAFASSRWLAQSIVKRWLGRFSTKRMLGSQNMMMLTVFVTRMIPFLSFDAVSYAAGLTALSLPRFTIATLFGLIPMSFLLTHAGEQWISSDGFGFLNWALIGGLAVVPPILTYLWTRNSILKTTVSKEIQ